MNNISFSRNIILRWASWGFLFLFTFNLCSCKKYLDAKPDQTISTPSTIDDLTGILNAYSFINARYPSSSEVASDDFYLSTADYNGLFDAQRFSYSWQRSETATTADYSSAYGGIEYANVILESLPKISGGNEQTRNNLRGNALFVRASYHFALAQLYAKQYNPLTSGSDPGIPLRLTADVAEKSVRSTVAANFISITEDLKHAVSLLPNVTDVKYKASKPAAYGMLARVYLTMGEYKVAGAYADSALSIYSTLINYSTLSATAALPFKQFNDEVIYDSRSIAATALAQTRAKIDTVLFSFYAPNDLRKVILFKANANGSYAFKGTYSGVTGNSVFTGIATNELYLIKAEAAARNGNTQTALDALNGLLITRWKKGTYIPYAITDKKLLLDLVLKERRKELPFRSLRWIDLRRLNLESEFAKTLTRNLSGTVYNLAPNSARYLFLIDSRAVDVGGLEQNP